MRFCVPDMPCCFPSNDQSGQSSHFIVDVEQILQDFVWNNFLSSRPSWQKLCIRRKDFIVDVPMNFFHFEKINEVVRPRQKPEATSIPQPPPSLVQSMTHVGQKVKDNPLLENTHVMLMGTDFTNSTGNDQTYSFKFEKTRKAALNVTFQKGFTLGGKVNFSLGLPKMAADGKVGGEVDMRLNISKATGEIIEETLTWGATSQITVASNSNYTAKVLMAEVPVSYDFQLWTKMSMPQGSAPATVTRKKPDTSRYTIIISSLNNVFKDYKGLVEIRKEPFGQTECTYTIIFKTTGIIDGVRLSNQKILLEGQELSASGASPQGHHDPDVSGGSKEVTSDGFVTSSSSSLVTSRQGRPLPLASSPNPPPPPSIPVIEEELEDDGGSGGGDAPYAVPPRGSVPRITTTAPSSQASSPLSDTGSPDMSTSDSSKKSQTVTTV